MGTEKPHRIWLSKYLQSNKNILSKGIVSARWLGVSPDGLTKHPHNVDEPLKYKKESLDSFYNNCLFEIVTESSQFTNYGKNTKTTFIWCTFYSII